MNLEPTIEELLIHEIQKAQKMALGPTARAHVYRVFEEQRQEKLYWVERAKKAERTLRHL